MFRFKTALLTSAALLLGIGGCSEVKDTYVPETKVGATKAEPVQKINPASFEEGELVFKKNPPARDSVKK